MHLLQGDFRILSQKLRPNSIDLIITDPPYSPAYCPLWTDLSREASRVLKPGCFLISFSGHYALPEILQRASQHLQYFWLGTFFFDREYLRRQTGMLAASKPILYFCKPPAPQLPKIPDFVISPRAEKDLHPWQQPIGVTRTLIERFSRPEDWILDPMAGTGTALLAARDSGRQAIGFELNQNTFETAQRRLGLPRKDRVLAAERSAGAR